MPTILTRGGPSIPVMLALVAHPPLTTFCLIHSTFYNGQTCLLGTQACWTIPQGYHHLTHYKRRDVHLLQPWTGKQTSLCPPRHKIITRRSIWTLDMLRGRRSTWSWMHHFFSTISTTKSSARWALYLSTKSHHGEYSTFPRRLSQ